MASPVSVSINDGVAIFTIDNPPVNSLHPRVLVGLKNAYDSIVNDPAVSAVVITGKNGIFVAGADIGFLQSSLEKNDLAAFSDLLKVNNALSQALESGPKPTVAAIDGNALGGGLELAMMCNSRVCTPRSGLGLPELRLGIIPGFGGTQRLPRLVGLQKALQTMLQSRTIKPNDALSSGLVDEVVEPDRLLVAAVSRAKAIASGALEKQRTLYRTDKLEPAEMAEAIFQFARDAIKSQPVYFPTACLNAVEAGVKNGGEVGLDVEQQEFNKCLQQPAAKALMHVFFAARATAKVPGTTDSGLKPRKLEKFAVVGGGLMGAGIATCLLVNGAKVVYFKEVNDKFLQGAVDRVKSNLARLEKSKKLTAAAHASCLERLKAQTTYDNFNTVDMVIEAVIENIPLKQKVFVELESVCSPQCVLATNTSTIDIDLVGAQTKSQDRIVGLHFFTPAHIMPLLEIVKTKNVSQQTLVDALAVAKMMKKTAIVVGNCVGFTVNRVFFPYGMAADLLVMSGVHPYRIDQAMQSFGIPMGPFRMADLVGGDVLGFVNQNFAGAYSDRVYVGPMRKLMLDDNRLGEKTKKGFYDYATGKFTPDAALDTYVERARAIAKLNPVSAVTDEDIQHALLLPIVNEATRVIDEGMVVRPSDIDIATIFGYGFPATRGGILHWADSELGSARIAARLEELNRKFNTKIFTPSAYLKSRAATNSPLSVESKTKTTTTSSASCPTKKCDSKCDDDVVIVESRRTALGRARRGGFKDTRPEDLLCAVLTDVIARTKINPREIGDVVVGTVLPKGEGAALDFRAAALLAGLPQEVPIRSVNRLCASGLQAIVDAATGIKAGHYDVAIAAGVESMSGSPMGMDLTVNPRVIGTPLSDVYLPMGSTSENVAERYGVNRADQDSFAVESHKRANAAIKSGKFKQEITPVTTEIKDDKTGESKKVTIDTDEGVRANTTVEGLAKLPPAFKMGGTSTAGNSSQLTDGAAAVLLMTRRKAKELGLKVQGTLRSFAVTGVDPAVMGIGPAVAIPKAVSAAGLNLKDVDLYEINEAFASQAVYCVRKLGLDSAKVNVNGGAIALGHPLGCTGARQTTTLMHEMERRKARFGVVSMCVGTGMGAAAVFERE